MPPKGRKSAKKHPKKARKKRPLTQRESIKQGNQALLDHFTKAQQNLEKRANFSMERLFQNQKSQNQGLGVAEDHILVVRRVLNDAMCGVTRVETISRPHWSEGAELGATEEVQVIDWGWYATQMLACKGVREFSRCLQAHLAQEDEKVRKERTKDAVLRVGRAVGKTELVNDLEDVEAAKKELLSETEEYAKLAAATIKAIEDGDEEAAARGMVELERQLQAKEAEGYHPPPPDDGIPEGAAVFGGS